MKIIIDTNVLVRMGFIWSSTVFSELPTGYVILTLDSLIKEFKNKGCLSEKFPDGFADDYIEELEKITLKVTKPEAKRIQEARDNFETVTQAFVESERKKEGKRKSSLSEPDLEILFTSVTLGISLATDEDPMRTAFCYLNEDDEIKLFSTITLLALLEELEVISPNQRKRCIKKIAADSDEFMPKGWKQQYCEVFKTKTLP